MSQEELTMLSIIIATSSLIVAAIALYISHFKGAEIESTIGPTIKLYYADFDIGGSTGIYLPVSLFNHSTRSSVVRNTGIEVYKKSSPHNRYFMHCRSFAELNFKENAWEEKDIVHSFPVLGKSSVQKHIWFLWEANNVEKLTLDEGIYCFDFLYWLSDKEKPIREHHEFVIDNNTAKILDDRKQTKKRATISVVLDKEMEMNKYLSSHESKQLLG